MERIEMEDVTSTNDYLINLSTEKDIVAVAGYQSAGKGMGTNTWESEPGQNLLFSILIHPSWLPIARQYLMSMAEALALHDAIAGQLHDCGCEEEVTIKWPNDIYVGDRKISGTRIDINLQGITIRDMVIGTGININQRAFHSDAPNPVSLWQLTGREHEADAILDKILSRFEHYRNMLHDGEEDAIIAMYHSRLYHREGVHRYMDDGGEFEAELIEVEPSGMMNLRKTDGTVSRYEFKEVRFLLSI